MDRTAYETKTAETLAVQALAWLAEDATRLGGFLAMTGAEAGTLRQAAGDPAFLGAVLDFLLTDDAHVLGFAAAADIAPETVAQARAALPGGDLPHWT